MSQIDPCTEITCENGNCVGCKNGQLWCDDPQCDPFCRGCEPPSDYETVTNMMLMIITIVFLVIIFMLLYFHGPRFVIMHDGDKTNVYEAIRDEGWGLSDV